MTAFSCVVIGNESLLVGCAEALLDKGHSIKAVVSQDAAIRDWAADKGLALHDTIPALTDAFPAGSFDWLFSIANLRVIPDAVLTLPARGAVNFHDGPLPRYAGLNTPAWALINREAQHGITWHMIESGIDTGDILEQVMFDIAEDETAFSLNSKCYAAAMDSFARLIPQFETGALTRSAQDLNNRGYYALADRPAAAGRLDFAKPAADLAALVRAMDFGGYWNPLVCPKLALPDGSVVLVRQAEVVSATSAAPGEVVDVTEASLDIATGEGVLRLTQLSDLFGQALSPKDLSEIGTTLPTLESSDAERLTQALASCLKGEPFWRKALAVFAPLELPLATVAGQPAQWDQMTLSCAGDLSVALNWARLSTGQKAGGVALATANITAASLPGYVNAWVPLSLEDDSAAVLDKAQTLGAFVADLIARDPALALSETPALGFAIGASTAIDGTAVTIAMPAGQPAVLHYDTARVDAASAKALAARLDAMLSDAASGAALPEGERAQVLADWNQSARSYDRSETVHRAIETQVSKTPDKIALVFEDRQLSYGALNAHANALAAELRKMGVVPGQHVGVYLRRSTDLVIAALAVMKAGGAYVPLDPAYPADRIAHFVTDSQATVILTQESLRANVPPTQAQILVPDWAAAQTADEDGGATADDLAYLIYTSGSTGTPKGVMVEHRNVANFCAGMDDRIEQGEDAVWLAVTSLSFDISVLELFYTLARGYKVVLAGDDNRAAVSNGAMAVSDTPIDFNLFYWGNDDGPGPRKYELLLEGAKFADANGFNAVWTPERHFHAFGGPYPNPSVTGAAVAAVTKNLSVRAGSCVAPLHHPARIAEEWSVIDNLTNGRAGLAIASGWQPDDFVLRPENTPPANKPAMYDSIDMLRKLWRGEAVEFPTQKGDMFPVVTQPRPVSKELPIWVTTAGNPDTWREAGEIGANVLTHLLGQSIDEVAGKIKIYHAALREAGHDPDDFTVTLMLHTYLDESREKAAEIAREPMKSYLRSAAGLIKQYAWAFPAFKRPKGVSNPFEVDLGGLGEDELEAILDFAFERYFEDSGLFGTIEDAVARTEQLKKIGVNEIACLIDYGIAPEIVLEGLKPLAEVLRRTNAPTELAEDDFSLVAQILRHKVTHLQCTPSMARIITMNDEARIALSRVKHLMLGGEALPADLLRDLRGCTKAGIQNMYGPTETTIWSTTDKVGEVAQGVAPIGSPIANTSVYVLDEMRQPVAIGVPGELCIGGEGVTRGYWQQTALTDDRFLPDPFAVEAGLTVTAAPRLYRTGDLVRWKADGQIEFLGRADHQVKIRGQRIELGEIESCLADFDGVSGAVVIAREHASGDVRLAGYITCTKPVAEPALRAHLAQHLTDTMVPADIVTLDAFPLTPNKKIDRKALPEPSAKRAAAPVRPAVSAAPADGIEAGIASIWAGILGVADIRPDDNFFTLGGHSLLAVQAHREIREKLNLPKLSITDIFRFPTLGGLAGHIGKGAAPAPTPEPAVPAQEKVQTMSRRRAMRAGRSERTG